VGKDAFLAMGFQDIENVRYYLHKKDQKGLMLKGRAWGNNLELQ
jgi:RsiW-degrading membrane proteinase PrsW (M82 family)